MLKLKRTKVNNCDQVHHSNIIPEKRFGFHHGKIELNATLIAVEKPLNNEYMQNTFGEQVFYCFLKTINNISLKILKTQITIIIFIYRNQPLEPFPKKLSSIHLFSIQVSTIKWDFFTVILPSPSTSTSQKADDLFTTNKV